MSELNLTKDSMTSKKDDTLKIIKGLSETANLINNSTTETNLSQEIENITQSNKIDTENNIDLTTTFKNSEIPTENNIETTTFKNSKISRENNIDLTTTFKNSEIPTENNIETTSFKSSEKSSTSSTFWSNGTIKRYAKNLQKVDTSEITKRIETYKSFVKTECSWRHFANYKVFSPPNSTTEAVTRFTKNIIRFRNNYFVITAGISCYAM